MQSEFTEIATALAKAQGQIEGAVKGKENPHFRSKYADLGAVWEACREHLTKNGISVIQRVARSAEGELAVTTTLLHASGQMVQDGGVPLLLSKQDMQGLGSAITYARRYGLMSMVGIAPEDDDGNAASQGNGKPVAVATPQPAKYGEWLLDLTSVADEGVEALKSAWTKSKPEFRQHLTKTAPDTWEGLKAKALQKEPVSA